MIYAHVFGLPVEETVASLAPVGVAVLAALRAQRFGRRRPRK